LSKVANLVAREAEALVTWRSAVTQAVLTAIVPVAGMLDFPNAGTAVLISRGFTLVWALTLLGVLLAQRKRPRLEFCRLACALAPLPLLVMFWLLIHERSARDLPLEIFIRGNVASLLFAMQTPPKAAANLVTISAFTVENLVLYWNGTIVRVPHTTSWLEPWTSLLVGACAVGLALYRARRMRREVQLIAAVERALALDRLTRSFLAVRDLANTPLQTLEVTLALLDARYPAAHDLTRKMARSLMRMRELNQILSAQASNLSWKNGGESFDPTSVLKEHAS
jgi:hypothetical protein